MCRAGGWTGSTRTSPAVFRSTSVHLISRRHRHRLPRRSWLRNSHCRSLSRRAIDSVVRRRWWAYSSERLGRHGTHEDELPFARQGRVCDRNRRRDDAGVEPRYSSLLTQHLVHRTPEGGSRPGPGSQPSPVPSSRLLSDQRTLQRNRDTRHVRVAIGRRLRETPHDHRFDLVGHAAAVCRERRRRLIEMRRQHPHRHPARER